VDEVGVFVPGHIVATAAMSDRVAGARFRRCPIAATMHPSIRDVITTHRRLSSDALRSTVRTRNLTAAMADALDVVDAEVHALHAWRQRQRQLSGGN